MKLLRGSRGLWLALLLLGLAAPGQLLADDFMLVATTSQSSSDDDDDKDSLSIKEAKWKHKKSQLKAKGKGRTGQKVMLLSVASGQVLGETIVKSGKWKIKATISPDFSQSPIKKAVFLA